MVEDLHATINSALREPDDAELDSAKARLADRGDFYLEAAAEYVAAFHRLTGRQVRQLTATPTVWRASQLAPSAFGAVDVTGAAYALIRV